MPYILIAIGVILLILLVTNIHVVQQSRAYVVERLGAYNTTWGVGCMSSCRSWTGWPKR